ncbi:MAG: HEAT repeat domain-containing protein [Deltaproteobacteria bacterium]|nr:HEAT repeat domain-containing protein [Deltaproteobacteria bacterium]
MASILAVACGGASTPDPDRQVAPTLSVADVGAVTDTASQEQDPAVSDQPQQASEDVRPGHVAVAVPTEEVALVQAEPPAVATARGDTHKVPREVFLSSEQVLATLEAVLAGEDAPRDPMWRWRAGATIDRDPKLPDEIADRITAPKSNAAGRELGVMILVAHGNAQAAVRRVLSDPHVRADPQYYAYLVQLLSMPRPQAQTVELVFASRSSEDMIVRRIATQVLGGQIGTLHAVGQTAAATKLAKRLQAEFKATSDVSERASILQAIGYGGLPKTRAFIRAFARSKHAALRIAAAKGMLLDDTTKAMKLLLALSVDADPEVQSAAVESLHAHTLTPAQQRTLHRSIMSDRLAPKNDGVLVHLIDKRLSGAARTQALEHLLARHSDGGWVKGHIDNALAR